MLSEVVGPSGCGFSYASTSIAAFIPETIPVSLRLDSETAGSAILQPSTKPDQTTTVFLLQIARSSPQSCSFNQGKKGDK